MAALVTPVSLRALFTTLTNTFAQMRGSVSTDLSMLAQPVPSTDLFETYAWLGAFPRFREWVGPRVVNGLKQRVYQIYNKDYEVTVGIDRNSLDDAKLIETTMIVTNMAQESGNLIHDLLINLLINGQAQVCYDGQYFFDTDHPTDPDLGVGSQSNYQASGFPLTRANFIQARATMRGFRGENNRPFGVGKTGGLVLVVPQALEQTATDIVVVDNIAISGGTQTNTLKGAAKMLVVSELDYLDSPTNWYLFDTAGMPAALITQERQAPRFVSKTAPNEENVFWYKEYIFGADARYGAGYGAWQKSFKAGA